MKELQAAEAILKSQGSIHLAKGQARPSRFKPKGKNWKKAKVSKGKSKKGGKPKGKKKDDASHSGKCFKCGDKGIGSEIVPN